MTSHGTYISDAVRDISSKMDEFSKIRVVKENRKPFIELSSSESSSDDEIVEAFDCEPGSNSSIDEIENVDPRLARNKRLRQNKVNHQVINSDSDDSTKNSNPKKRNKNKRIYTTQETICVNSSSDEGELDKEMEAYLNDLSSKNNTKLHRSSTVNQEKTNGSQSKSKSTAKSKSTKSGSTNLVRRKSARLQEKSFNTSMESTSSRRSTTSSKSRGKNKSTTKTGSTPQAKKSKASSSGSNILPCLDNSMSSQGSIGRGKRRTKNNKNNNTLDEVDKLNDSFSDLKSRSPPGKKTPTQKKRSVFDKRTYSNQSPLNSPSTASPNSIEIKIKFNNETPSTITISKNKNYFYNQVLQKTLEKYSIPLEDYSKYRINNEGYSCDLELNDTYIQLEKKSLFNRFSHTLTVFYLGDTPMHHSNSDDSDNLDDSMMNDGKVTLKINCKLDKDSTEVEVDIKTATIGDIIKNLIKKNPEYFCAFNTPQLKQEQGKTYKKVLKNDGRSKKQMMIDFNLEICNGGMEDFLTWYDPARPAAFGPDCQAYYKQLEGLCYETVEVNAKGKKQKKYKLVLAFDGEKMTDTTVELGPQDLDCEDGDIFDCVEIEVDE